jgi:splicing factor 3B subunit 2
MKEKLPGLLSADLIAALGMQEGSPPPWLINMQRYGPPPSYPNLRIPGLNAPLPPGASYGYQPGGWGKPPVDEYGRPLYGDVFGNSIVTEVDNSNGVDKEFRWGSFEFEEEVNEEDEDLEEEEAGELQPRDHRFDKTGFETPASIDGNSLISGLETPDTIDLRKREGFETPDVLVNRELFHVIQERKISSSGQLFGSERQYVLPGKSDVQLSINPDDLEDMLNNNEKMKDAHDAQALNVQSDILFRHVSNRNASEAEDDKNQGKKRKAEAPLVYKKAKEFKF